MHGVVLNERVLEGFKTCGDAPIESSERAQVTVGQLSGKVGDVSAGVHDIGHWQPSEAISSLIVPGQKEIANLVKAIARGEFDPKIGENVALNVRLLPHLSHQMGRQPDQKPILDALDGSLKAQDQQFRIFVSANGINGFQAVDEAKNDRGCPRTREIFRSELERWGEAVWVEMPSPARYALVLGASFQPYLHDAVELYDFMLRFGDRDEVELGSFAAAFAIQEFRSPSSPARYREQVGQALEWYHEGVRATLSGENRFCSSSELDSGVRLHFRKLPWIDDASSLRLVLQLIDRELGLVRGS